MHSLDHVALQSVPRPVAAMAKKYPAHYEGYMHTHARAQLLYAVSGSMRLTLPRGCWIVPPKRAVWIPAECVHQTGSFGELEMRTLYIDSNAIPDAPDEPRMLIVSSLLHELVLRAVELPIEYDEVGQPGRIIEVLLHEIDWTPVTPFSLPNIDDQRLRYMHDTLQKNPADQRTLGEWARHFQISPRTMARLIKAQTDLTFQSWRDHVRVFTALPWIAEGKPFAEISDALGFDTAWSFTAMFRRVVGTTPREHRQK
jgi:AraC-like DNA-binding protein